MRESMNLKEIGLYLFAIGIVLLVIYGIYRLIPALQYVDPFVLVSITIIFLGIVLILVSVIREKGKGEEKISKEDLEP